MKVLLDDYKATAKTTRKLKKELDHEAALCQEEIQHVHTQVTSIRLQQEAGEEEETEEQIGHLKNEWSELRQRQKELRRDQDIVNSMTSSLSYSIHCIRYNTEPPVARNIERRAYYEREIPFEHHWIERRKEDESLALYDPWPAEQSVDEEYEEEIRKELVKEIKKCLTPRQIDVMELVSMDFSATQIGEMLGITKRAVNYAIEAARKKIKDEGWQMI